MQKAALITSGIIFLIVSLLHIARILLNGTVTVAGSYQVPMALSWVGAAVSLALAVWMFAAAKK